MSIRPLPGATWGRVRTWNLGGVILTAGAGSGVAVGRARDNAARAPGGTGGESHGLLTVAAVSPGDWTFAQFGHTVTPLPECDTLILVDHTAPHDFRRRDAGAAVGVTLDRSAAGIPTTTVRAAGPHLHEVAALHETVRHGLTYLAEVAAGHPQLLADLVDPVVDLVRALVLGCAAGHDQREDTLLQQITRHVDEHLADPGLDPASVAAAHHISVRTLHSLFAPTGVSFGRHLLARRLDAARTALTDNRNRHLTIAAIARRHGFTDLTHFTRRFRAAYGVTPGRLRRSATGGPGP